MCRDVRHCLANHDNALRLSIMHRQSCYSPCCWCTKAAASKSVGVRGPSRTVLALLQCCGTCSRVRVTFGCAVTLSLRWCPAHPTSLKLSMVEALVQVEAISAACLTDKCHTYAVLLLGCQCWLHDMLKLLLFCRSCTDVAKSAYVLTALLMFCICSRESPLL